MFWKFNLVSSNIDTLLEQEDVSLLTILDEDDVLQECKAQNQKLVQFLVRENNISALVNYVVSDPNPEEEETKKYKYANIACELLTSDVDAITEQLTGSEPLLQMLFDFFNREPPLNPLSASFVCKVFILLATKKMGQLFESFQRQQGFIPSLMRHLATSSVADLLLKLCTCSDQQNELRDQVAQWLLNQDTLSLLFGLLGPNSTELERDNVTQLLQDLLRISRELRNHPLLDALLSVTSLAALANRAVDGEPLGGVLCRCIDVLQIAAELTKPGSDPIGLVPDEQRPETEADREFRQSVSTRLAEALLPVVDRLHHLLVSWPKGAPMPSTLGDLDPPLGHARLALSSLLAAAFELQNGALNARFRELHSLEALLDLLFAYEWNSLLHSNILKAVEAAVKDEAMFEHLVKECTVTEKITKFWQTPEEASAAPAMGTRPRRRGFMGHLTEIANLLVSQRDRVQMSEHQMQEWNNFTSGALVETNRRNETELGSRPLSGSDDDDSDFREVSFAPENEFRQSFKAYRTVEMTASFVEQFAFKEEDFSLQKQRASAFEERLAGLNFGVEGPSSTGQADMWSAPVQDLEDEDEWPERQITFENGQNAAPIGTLGGRTSSPRASSPADSSSDSISSDDEPPMEVEHAAPAPEPVTDPWGEQSTAANQEGWASWGEADKQPTFQRSDSAGFAFDGAAPVDPGAASRAANYEVATDSPQMEAETPSEEELSSNFHFLTSSGLLKAESSAS